MSTRLHLHFGDRGVIGKVLCVECVKCQGFHPQTQHSHGYLLLYIKTPDITMECFSHVFITLENHHDIPYTIFLTSVKNIDDFH